MSYNLTIEALRALFEELGMDDSGLSVVFENYGLFPSERAVKRLFWRDNMENYLTNKWTPIGGADTVEYSTDIPAFEGDYVLELNDPGDSVSQCVARFGMLPEKKNSVELAWYRDSNTREMRAVIGIHNGTIHRPAHIQWNEPLSRWEYWGGTPPAWHPVPGGDEGIRNDTWNYLKLIADWENGTYVTLITTGLEIDMSSISLPSSSTTDQFTYVVLRKRTFGIFPAYFDDVRLYLNEVV